MWQVFWNAIPTRDNIRKKKWPGNPTCSFCDQVETVDHLFFTCPVAKVTWNVLGKAIGTSTRPLNLWQAIAWVYAFLPGGETFYMVGLAAIRWSIWVTRNKVTFEGHVVRSPFEIVFTVCSFLLYWSGLQGNDDKAELAEGAKKLMKLATALA